jgi:hypothetical protein
MSRNMTAVPCPPWQDISTLCANICVCERTVDAWVKRGLLPLPRLIGGKRLWKWAEVDEYLGRDSLKTNEDNDVARIREATRRLKNS